MPFSARLLPTIAALALAAAAPSMLVLSAPSPAHAQSAAKAAVDAAKAAGVVGEQHDGYLGVVAGADATVRAAVAEINAGRAGAYAETAAKTGVTPSAAGEATFRQIMARMPVGQFYRPEGAAWRRK